MKVPIKWLADYVSLPKDITKLTDSLTLAGHMLDKKEFYKGQAVIDLELRGNRADCYSILGIAREVAALTNKKIKQPPIVKKIKEVKELEQVQLRVQTPLVQRVVMIEIKDVVIEKSPDWLANKLEAYGIEPINNIVDLTNFVTVETGQPMHAFDLDLVGEKIEIRLAKKDESLLTFQDTVIYLTTDDLVWVNNDNVLSVAGAIGGKKHSVNKNTKNILLEAASYNQANIRRSVHRHNLFTDAGIRHEKNLDPNLVDMAVYRFLYLLAQNKWGRIEKKIVDYYPKPIKPWKLSLDYEKVKRVAGLNLTNTKIKSTLTALNFETKKTDRKKLTVLVPTYRTDVTQEEDLIEEVVRIIGYDKIPLNVLSKQIPANITPNYIKQELDLKESLTGLGFDEVISLSFVNEKSLKRNVAYEKNKVELVTVQNAPSPDAKVMRMTLLPNLMEFTQKVKNERGEYSQFFEIGKVYFREQGQYTEKRRLGLTFWAKDASYQHFKGILESFFAKIGLENVEFDIALDHPILKDAYTLTTGKQTIGYGGKTKGVFYVEIDLDSVLSKTKQPQATMWPKYPPQIEDITFSLPEKTLLGKVIKQMEVTPQVQKVKLVDQYKNYYSFRIWYQDNKKTLDNKEVKQIRTKIINSLQNKFGAAVKN